MTRSKSVTESEVPLYLVPRVIGRQICHVGDSVYRISVKRTHWHHYNISVRTKWLPRELAPVRVIRPDDCMNPIPGNPQSIGEPEPESVA
jgi:hypothetical protein